MLSFNESFFFFFNHPGRMTSFYLHSFNGDEMCRQALGREREG